MRATNGEPIFASETYITRISALDTIAAIQAAYGPGHELPIKLLQGAEKVNANERRSN
jgi:hypothetical protein